MTLHITDRFIRIGLLRDHPLSKRVFAVGVNVPIVIGEPLTYNGVDLGKIEDGFIEPNGTLTVLVRLYDGIFVGVDPAKEPS